MTHHTELDCRQGDCTQIEQLLSAALDDALTAQESALVRAHVAVCPSCRALEADFAQMSAALRALEEPAPDLLVAQVLRQLPRARPARERVYWQRWAAMAAVFALVVTGGVAMRHWLGPAPKSGEVTPEQSAHLSVADAATLAGGAEATSSEESALTGADSAAAPFAAKAVQDAPLAPEGEADMGVRMLPEPPPKQDSPAQDAPSAGTGEPAPVSVAEPNLADTDTITFTAPDAGELPESVQTQGGEQGEVQGETPTAAPVRMRTMIAPIAAALTPAEAEAVLRLHIGGGELEYVGILPGGAYFRFDRTDLTAVYAISCDGQTIVEQNTPEAAMIADWDVEGSD